VTDETATSRPGELRIRLRGSLDLASSEAARVFWMLGGGEYKICLDAAFTPHHTPKFFNKF
jgi:hypothetical protein